MILHIISTKADVHASAFFVLGGEVSCKEGEAGTMKLSELVQASARTFVLTAQADACARLGL